jgi:hypothetical protein
LRDDDDDDEEGDWRWCFGSFTLILVMAFGNRRQWRLLGNWDEARFGYEETMGLRCLDEMLGLID